MNQMILSLFNLPKDISKREEATDFFEFNNFTIIKYAKHVQIFLECRFY